MQVTSLKEEAINAIGQLPDSAGVEEMMYRLYVIDKVRKGQESAKQEPLLSVEELKREIDEW